MTENPNDTFYGFSLYDKWYAAFRRWMQLWRYIITLKNKNYEYFLLQNAKTCNSWKQFHIWMQEVSLFAEIPNNSLWQGWPNF